MFLLLILPHIKMAGGGRGARLLLSMFAWMNLSSLPGGSMESEGLTSLKTDSLAWNHEVRCSICHEKCNWCNFQRNGHPSNAKLSVIFPRNLRNSSWNYFVPRPFGHWRDNYGPGKTNAHSGRALCRYSTRPPPPILTQKVGQPRDLDASTAPLLHEKFWLHWN